ncbi:MAG TPA: hypothetical protein VMJ32_00865 [Pirellulales bacterium]|nr:hypothetical protein [Pirellulales bacterium]
MSNFLLYYERVSPTTWVYLSSLLIISLFFKFNRLWSVRNLDLIGLILLAPGLLFVIYGQEKGSPAHEQTGYIWLFVIGGLFLVRMLLDPMMVRRPLLEPNLSVGGLTFLGLSLLIFLMANVATNRSTESPDSKPAADVPAASTSENPALSQPQADREKTENPAAEEPLVLYGPGYPWVFEIFQLPTRFVFQANHQSESANSTLAEESQNSLKLATARTVAIFSYLAIIIGLVLIGYRHFDNIKTGIAAAVLYLLLPYTAILTGHYMDSSAHIGQVYHVSLAALLVWAVAMYRRPLISGILLGLAIGMFYYPIFLLPLWCSFYWKRGGKRFAVGVAAMLVLLVIILYMHPYGTSFSANLRQMFGWILPRMENLKGFWRLSFNDPVYRIPVLAAFVAMCITMTIWPAQKNLGTLMSCSAAVMLGTQFWHALGGGQLLAWYLPLTLLTIFRPNLEDRVALSVLGQWSFTKRKPNVSAVDQAA